MDARGRIRLEDFLRVFNSEMFSADESFNLSDTVNMVSLNLTLHFCTINKPVNTVVVL